MHDLMIVGESPSETRPEGMEEVAFSGKTSHILWDELKKYGITRAGCFVTNVIIDHIKKGDEVPADIITRNHRRLDEEIRKEKPLVILAVGRVALRRFVDKGESIVNLAGSLFEDERACIVPCIHPAAVSRNWSMKKPFQDCIYVAAEALKILRAAKINAED
jgi:uracil-DNA glycosylase family 4